MKVKCKAHKLLYQGEIHSKDEIFDMDPVTAAISRKYNKIEILEAAADEGEEFETLESLPPLKSKKK